MLPVSTRVKGMWHLWAALSIPLTSPHEYLKQFDWIHQEYNERAMPDSEICFCQSPLKCTTESVIRLSCDSNNIAPIWGIKRKSSFLNGKHKQGHILHMCIFIVRIYWERMIKLWWTAGNGWGFKLYLCDTPASITRRDYIGADLIWMDPFYRGGCLLE